MINTLSNGVYRKKVETDGFGVNIMPEDEEILADAIEKLYENEDVRKEMGKQARKIAEEQFDRPESYKKIVELIQVLIER